MSIFLFSTTMYHQLRAWVLPSYQYHGFHIAMHMHTAMTAQINHLHPCPAEGMMKDDEE